MRTKIFLMVWFWLLPFKVIAAVNAWTSLGPSTITPSPVAHVIATDDGRTLYAGLANGGVFMGRVNTSTPSGGVFWTNFNNGTLGDPGALGNLTIRHLVLSPDRMTLYAGTAGGIFRGQITYTSDQPTSISWSSSNGEGSTSLATTSILFLILSSDASTLYAATNNGVYQGQISSTAIQWQEFSNGAVGTPDALGNRDVRALWLSPDNRRLYVATARGVFRGQINLSGSTPSSIRWGSFNGSGTGSLGPPSAPLSSLNLLLTPDEATAYVATGASVYRGSISGTDPSATVRWTQAGGGVLDSTLIRTLVLSSDRNTLYAGATTGGVFRGVVSPSSISWSNFNNGNDTLFPGTLGDRRLRALVIAESGFLYAATQGGLYKGIIQTTGGTTQVNWLNYNNNGPEFITPLGGLTVTSFASSSDGNTLFIGTFSGGVFRGRLSGNSTPLASWVDMNGASPSSLSQKNVRKVLYVQSQNVLYVATSGGVFRGVLGGTDTAPTITWSAFNGTASPLNTVDTRDLLISQDGNSLYAATFGGGVFRGLINTSTSPPSPPSIDWTAINSSGSSALTDLFVQKLLMNSDERILLAGTLTHGVVMGDITPSPFNVSWSEVNGSGSESLGHLNVRDLVWSENQTALYVGTLGGGIFRGRIQGSRITWTDQNNSTSTTENLAHREVLTLRLLPQERNLVVGVNGGGFYVGHLNGVSPIRWSRLNSGLRNLNIPSLFISPTSPFSIYAGTGGSATAQLQLQKCGNLIIEPGEVCDDGNVIGLDGCSADCRTVELPRPPGSGGGSGGVGGTSGIGGSGTGGSGGNLGSGGSGGGSGSGSDSGTPTGSPGSPVQEPPHSPGSEQEASSEGSVEEGGCSLVPFFD